MKSLLLLLLTVTTLATITTAFVCDIPTSGCKNGMFNQAKCTCDCIKPFCPDSQGQCTIAGGSCPDPWTDCERGVNCPWWVNPNKAEACTTGPLVPAGLWVIYNTEEICCKGNFPYSEACMAAPATSPPTKHPTISRPEDDTFEAVPIKFEVIGLPEGVNRRELQAEMLMVLKRIVLRLADRIQGLKISSVEEKTVITRRLLSDVEDEDENEKPTASLRQRLLQDDNVSFYYNIFVVRDDDKKFGPLIIQEMRDSYKEILEQIQTFSDIKFFSTEDINLNWCAFQNGKYELCVQENKSPPAPVRAPTPVMIQSDPEPEGGLAGWAVAIIVIFVLIFVCCVGYAIAVFCFGVASCFGGGHDETKINNNIYWDEDKSERSGYDDGRSYGGRSRGGRSRASGYADKHLAIMPPPDEYNDNHLAIMDDNRTQATGYSRRTGRSSRRSGKSQQLALQAQEEESRSSKWGLKRDPTQYIPGQEDKPDPDSNILMLTDGDARSRTSSRKYMEDPPLKPKKDPTMYVQGGHGNYSAGDPPLKPKRDPTMFVEGQMDPTMFVEGQQDPTVYVDDAGRDPSMYAEGGQEPSMYNGSSRSRKPRSMYSEAESVEEMYNDDLRPPAQYGIHGIDEEEEYDQYGFKSNSQYDEAGGRREPSYYEDSNSRSGDTSFRTQEPSVSGNESSKSKKSSKKKGGSRKSGKNKGSLRQSLQSNWESNPDVSGRVMGEDQSRQVKSFYK